MLRWLFLLFSAALVLWLDVQLAYAQAPTPTPTDTWPALPPFVRGPGYYLATWKILTPWFLLAMWAFTTDWVSQDCLNKKFDYSLWNSVNFFPFVVAFVLLWLIPWFILGFLLLLVSYFAPLGTYIWYRNGQVEMHERVLTPAHLRYMVAVCANAVGIKMEMEKKSEHELGPDVQLAAMGGATERDDNVNLLTARQSPGFLLARTLIFDAVKHRADGIRLDFTEQSVAVQYQIDGVWHNYAPQERANGDVMLAVMKTLAALNINERRARQAGKFGATVTGEKYLCRIISQGTKTGELVVLQLEGKKALFKNMEELGMRPKMEEQLMELLNQRSGFFLVSSMPAGGLTTTFDCLLDSTDRYMRNFVGVEDEGKPERELENIPITKYKAAAGETPLTVLPKLIRTYPDVIVIRDLVDGDTVKLLIDQVHENRLIISSIRAKEAVEALLRVLMLKVPSGEFAPVATGVLNVRLVRKLCEKCKEAYTPPPEVLKQLGLPAGRIEAFYRPPAPPPEPEKICQECLGIGYKGRTAIFELLVLDDTLRNLLASTPKLDVLRQAVRKSKQRTLQEEGILLVARGVTSMPELLRVLKV